MGCLCSKYKSNSKKQKVYLNKPLDASGSAVELVVNKPEMVRQKTNPYILDMGELDRMQESIQMDAENQIKLQHIIESIYDAAVKAHNNVQINNLHNLFWLLPTNEKGIHVPKCMPLQVPNDGDGDQPYKVVNVPIITLMNQQNLNISEMKISTTVDMELESAPKQKENSSGCLYDIKKKDYSLRLVPGDKSTSIEMTIKMDPPLEIYNRILGKLEKQI